MARATRKIALRHRVSVSRSERPLCPTSHTNASGLISTSHIVASHITKLLLSFRQILQFRFRDNPQGRIPPWKVTKTRPFLSTCYGDPSATEVPPCCEAATTKLTFSTTSVLGPTAVKMNRKVNTILSPDVLYVAPLTSTRFAYSTANNGDNWARCRLSQWCFNLVVIFEVSQTFRHGRSGFFAATQIPSRKQLLFL